ncbi:ABC transporter substrate-binding protein [Roseiarcaceae bacterium H3SJ34-1]|uniref:ABC transporter substrate-binding protein n=1 Tax=Terripilifer ovatus TaxID=3032367 RepID=UPI003AB98D15|nr:ABC transporter substrate-binding protein [Roseiarcaceae bacterium H3SJ34-1]
MPFRMLRVIASLALAMVCSGVAPAQTAAPAGAGKTIKVAYLKSLSFSPLFAAIEKKYFADEGLEIELQIVQSSSEVVAFLARGQIDVAFGNVAVPFFNGVRNGFDVRLLAGVSYAASDAAQPSPNPIVIAKAREQEIRSPADLRGRKVAVNTRGGIIEYQFAAALKVAGLSINDVEIVTLGFPDMITALMNGVVHAAIVPEPLATSAIEKGLVVSLVGNPGPGAMLTVATIGKNLMAPEGGPTTEAFLRALRRASAELASGQRTMSPANLAIWAKYTDIPAAVIAKTRPYAFDKDLAIDLRDLERQQGYLVETKQVPGALPLDQLVDGHAKVLR